MISGSPPHLETPPQRRRRNRHQEQRRRRRVIRINRQSLDDERDLDDVRIEVQRRQLSTPTRMAVMARRTSQEATYAPTPTPSAIDSESGGPGVIVGYSTPDSPGWTLVQRASGRRRWVRSVGPGPDSEMHQPD